MNILIVGTYHFDIVGNGMVDEMEIPLNRLKTPDPIIDGQLPIAIVQSTIKPPGTTATLVDGVLKLKFNIPPSAAKVVVEALFGKQN